MNSVISFPRARQLAPDTALALRRRPAAGASIGIDAAALLAAAQAFAGELLQERLVESIAAVMREQAGASRAVLVLVRDGRQRIAARAPARVAICGETSQVDATDVPLTLLAAVMQSGRAIVLDHAQLIDRYGDDRYLRQHIPHAAACLPLMTRKELGGLLYLEHAGAPHLFAPELVAALAILADQAAIALDNARRYQLLMAENRQLRQAGDGLRRGQAELARAARVTTMGELAASIAHEVNQPLSAIALNAGAGLNWLKREPPDLVQVRNALELVAAAASRAGDIVRSIRGLARRTGPETSEFAIDEALREVLPLLRSELQQQGIALRCELTLAGGTVSADRAQLQQVFLNLLMNAIEAIADQVGKSGGDSGAGGGSGNGKKSGRREIAIGSWMEQEQLHVCVEDSGPGLSAASAERVFEALFSTKRDGMGMGLSICRSIVEAHGGSIWCGGSGLGGAAFHVCLPRRPAAERCGAAEKRSP
jgi:signal transduction histidine kinase